MKQSVLIIDDDPDIGELISQAAQTFGHDCTPTSDVASFWASLSPTTAIVFLDLVMPDVDGIQILRQLALQKSRAALILMSGVELRSLAGHVLGLGRCLPDGLGLALIASVAPHLALLAMQQIRQHRYV